LNTKDIDGKWSEDFGVPSYLKEYNRLYQTTENSSNRPSEFRYVRDRLAKTHDRLFELALDLRRSPNLDKLMKLQAENDAKQALNNNIIKYV
jgi:hypothetical protein